MNPTKYTTLKELATVPSEFVTTLDLVSQCLHHILELINLFEHTMLCLLVPFFKSQNLHNNYHQIRLKGTIKNKSKTIQQVEFTNPAAPIKAKYLNILMQTHLKN